MDIFSVECVALTILGYPMSWIELVGTVLYLASVWLIARRDILTWPVGIVSVVLYMLLFYQIRLYSDAIEQVYYLGASVYGWVVWARSPRIDGRVGGVAWSGPRALVLAGLATAALSAGAGLFMASAHRLAPRLFPEAASYPWLDALTTVMSFTAMWLMARKRIESWIYWLIVDALGIGIYAAKQVYLIAVLYVILLVLAARGLRLWLADRRSHG